MRDVTPRVLSSSTLMHDTVRNPQGERLGEIKDFMIDLSNGRVVYAVLSFGGFLGIGDKLFAIPWEALEVDTVNENFVLDVSKERLENAPGFDKDNWPTHPDQDFINRVYTHYGYDPYYDESGQIHSRFGTLGTERTTASMSGTITGARHGSETNRF